MKAIVMEFCLNKLPDALWHFVIASEMNIVRTVPPEPDTRLVARLFSGGSQ
jgi:hypothetical protein